MRVRQNEIDQLRRALHGRYHIGPEIGAGGMSTVYRATDIRHDRDVALKLLAGQATAHLGDRFAREIQITAALQHPHVLPLLDSGSIGHLHFFVTPYIAGHSLGQLLAERGALPVHDALRLTSEIAGALAHAHANDIVHLDVKPANILLSDRHAMVADFGIARAVSENCRDTEGSGVPVGTPSYMSPEQVSGSGCLDGRSDIYSLGCVLFEMLTGVPPFGDASATSVLSKHIHANVPSVRARRMAVPRHVDLAIRRAMAKDPADRFQSMDAFVRALERPQPVRATQRPLRRVPYRLRVGAATLGIAMLSAFGLSISKTVASPPVADRADPLAAELEEGNERPAIDATVVEPDEPVAPC